MARVHINSKRLRPNVPVVPYLPALCTESRLAARNTGACNTESAFSVSMSIWYDTAESELVLLGIYIYISLFYF